jgi:hypothetical protein
MGFLYYSNGALLAFAYHCDIKKSDLSVAFFMQEAARDRLFPPSLPLQI